MASILRCLVVLWVASTCMAGDPLPDLFNAGAEVAFGQSAAFAGPAGALGTQMRLGIQAAFAEANGRRGPGVPSLGLISYNDGYEPGPSADNTKKLIQEHGVFALIGEVGTPTSQVAAPIATASKVPFVGAFTGAKFLRSPYNRYIVNYRASYIDETASMVNMFVNGMYLSRISIVYQADSFGAAGYEGVDLALRVRRMVIHSEGTYERNTVNISGAIEALRARPDPEAVIMIGAYAPLAAFVKEAKKLWPKAFFATVSFVGSYAFAAGLETAEMRENVFITQVVDFPEDPSVQLVAEYKAALRSLYPSAAPDFTSLEGYIAGRMCAEVVARVASRGNVTREAFLDEIYDGMMMVVGGLRLGPFGGDCPQTKSGCRCNQGQRQVYGTRILGNGGFARHAPLDFTFATCGFQASDSNSIIFGQSVDLSGPSASFGKSFQAGLLAAFQQANQKRVLGSFVVKLSSLDDASDPATALANARTLLSQGGAFALIGSVGAETSVGMLPALSESNAPLVGPASGAGSLRWPFNRGVANIRASSVDETAAIVAFFVMHLGLKKFAVFAESGERGASGGAGVDIALRSYGLTVYSNATYNRSSLDVEAGLEVLRLGGAPDVVVLLGSVEPLAKFVKLAKEVWPTCHFGATSFLDGETMSSLLETPGMRANVLITSVVPLPTDTSLAVVRSYQEGMRRFNSSLPLSSASFEAFLAAAFAFQILKMLPVIARQAFVDKIYETQRVSVADGMTLGPFMEPSRSDREGCNVGMRAVFLTQMKPSGVLEYAEGLPAFEFPDRCGMRIPRCTAGYYRSSPDEVCQFCGPGNFAHDGECSACPLGSLGGKISSQACELCPAGSYTDAVGQTSCKPCLPGTFGADQGASACTLCRAGLQQTNPGSFACEPCGFGTFASEEGTGTCTRCPVGTFASSMGLTDCTRCMAPLTTVYPGAITEAECLCPVGVYEPSEIQDVCLPCPTGMVCSEVGTKESNIPRLGSDVAGPFPTSARGFMTRWDAPMTPLKCATATWCPGGRPGTCVARRDAKSLGCSKCEVGSHGSSGAGPCRPCKSGQGQAVLACIIVISFAVLIVITVVVNRSTVVQTSAANQCVLVMGVTFTAIQTLGIFDNLSVQWLDPLKSIFNVMALFSFDVSIAQSECWMSQDPLPTYALRLSIAPISLSYIALVNVLRKFCVAAGLDVVSDTVNAAGAVFQVFFVSIVISVLTPYVCYRHPGNVGESMTSDPSVLCFQGGEHAGFVVLSVIACLFVVIPYLSVTARATFLHPQTMLVSSKAEVHLRKYKFLFYRFTPECYWYGFVMLMRGVLLCLVPVVFRNQIALQITAMTASLLCFLGIQAFTHPWRSSSVNIMEGAVLGCMVLLLQIASMGMEFENRDELLGILGMMLCVFLLLLVICFAVQAVYRRFNPRPFYPRFLSHHKDAAAAQARYLQLKLKSATRQECFIDSDHLNSLEDLFDVLKFRTGQLIVYLTSETLRRAWCAGEIAVVFSTHRRAIAVDTASFVSPSNPFSEQDVSVYLANAAVNLVEYGVTYAMIASAYNWLVASVKHLAVPRGRGRARFDSIVCTLTGQAVLTGSSAVASFQQGAILVSSQLGDEEATASVGILVSKLQAQAVEQVSAGFAVLVDLCESPSWTHNGILDAIPASSAIISVMSPGSMDSKEQLDVILRAVQEGVRTIPVFMPKFTPPTACLKSALSTLFPGNADDVARAVQTCFKTIALPLQIDSSDHMLTVQCQAVMQRLVTNTCGTYTKTSCVQDALAKLRRSSPAVLCFRSSLDGPSTTSSSAHAAPSSTPPLAPSCTPQSAPSPHGGASAGSSGDSPPSDDVKQADSDDSAYST